MPTAERAGFTSTRRRLFDMDSILALDDCKQTSAQGHDVSQGRERDSRRHEEVDGIVDTHTVSVSVTMVTVGGRLNTIPW
jgi:hypothetical protein